LTRYYRLRDTVIHGRWHLGVITAPDGTEPWLLEGASYDGPTPLSARIHHAGRVLDYCQTSYAVPVCRPELAAAIQAVAGADLQQLRLRVDGDDIDMVALNATRSIRCLDESASVFTKWTADGPRPDLVGDYREVLRFTVDPSAIPPNAHFFRLGGFEPVLIVSAAVKDAMEALPHEGAEFHELAMRARSN
jgi:hypothetical protein